MADEGPENSIGVLGIIGVTATVAIPEGVSVEGAVSKIDSVLNSLGVPGKAYAVVGRTDRIRVGIPEHKEGDGLTAHRLVRRLHNIPKVFDEIDKQLEELRPTPVSD